MRGKDAVGNETVTGSSAEGGSFQLGGGTSAPAAASTDDVVALVREAASRGTALRIAGAGTWLKAGRPIARHTAPLGLAGLCGVVEYVPGDLTLTARAGTRLATIAEVTGDYGQWFPVDPVAQTTATLGATIATASEGPLAHAMGRVRDQILGLEFVTGEGRVARGGGRVVKNVAGFDLVRLQVGAWGSLGVITEATVRLRARPECDETVLVSCAASSLGDVGAALRHLPAAPLAAELLCDTAGRRIGVAPSGHPLLLVRLAGNEGTVRALRHGLAALGDQGPAPSDAWSRLQSPEPIDTSVLRASGLPTEFDALWNGLERHLGRALLARQGSPLRGVVRCVLQDVAPAALGSAVKDIRDSGWRVALEQVPAPVWDLEAEDPARAKISASLRRAFDPRGVLNPGIRGTP